MNLLITGVSTNNKGAELMLIAVTRHFADHFPECNLCVSHHCGNYLTRARYGLYQVPEPARFGRSRLGLSLLPSPLRRSLGLFSETDIDAIIDASGFAFGDQLALQRLNGFAKDIRRWKRQGKKIILLPQAFGPFHNEPHRRAFQSLLPMIDLLYARDAASLSHLREITSDTRNLFLSPDITIPLGQGAGGDPGADSKQVLFVPNYRMMDQTHSEISTRYPKTLATGIEAVSDLGFSPALLLHDAHEDQALVPDIETHLRKPVPVLRERCPMALKRVIGGSRLLVGSRFHALVGALSQGIPAIAFGWSHKYQELFHDFDCGDMVLDARAPLTEFERALHRALSQDTGDSLVSCIASAARRQTSRVETMWPQVHDTLGLSTHH